MYFSRKVVTLDLMDLSQFVQYVNLNYRVFLYCESVAKFFVALRAAAEPQPTGFFRKGEIDETFTANSNGAVNLVKNSEGANPPFWISKTFHYTDKNRV